MIYLILLLIPTIFALEAIEYPETVESTGIQTPESSLESAHHDQPDIAPSPLTIRGLVLLSSQNELLQDGGWEPGTVLCPTLLLPGCSQALVDHLYSNYVGAPLNQEVLLEIKESILKYYRDCHHPFVIVEIPGQNITQGVIQFVVTEACLGEINAYGSCWFDDTYFRTRLGIAPGQTITTDALLTNVAWLNQNPFHRSDLKFRPGDEPGTTSIDLVTQDRFPLRPYIGVDNTGNRATGYSRYFAGLTWGNVFGLDHQLTYQITTASNVSHFLAQSLNYVAPLPWKNNLYLFGGYATVSPGVAHFLRCDGHSSQISMRYEIPIGSLVTETYQTLRFGFDYKNTNNNLVFLSENEIPLIVHNINLSQFMLGYDIGVDVWDHLFEASYEIYCSPGQLLPDETKRDYAMLSPGATARYIYGRLTAGYVHAFCFGTTLGLVARGQYSNSNLLPSEQFGLGGYDTVRGYNEREVNVDNAACFNIEWRSKPFNFFNYTYCNCNFCDQLIGLVFMDFGTGYNHKGGICHNDRFTLWSVGTGLRYNISNFLAARFDVGFKLRRTIFDNNNNGRVHFGIIASY